MAEMRTSFAFLLLVITVVFHGTDEVLGNQSDDNFEYLLNEDSATSKEPLLNPNMMCALFGRNSKACNPLGVLDESYALPQKQSIPETRDGEEEFSSPCRNRRPCKILFRRPSNDQLQAERTNKRRHGMDQSAQFYSGW